MSTINRHNNTLLTLCALLIFSPLHSASAQIDLRISPSDSDFTIAAPVICNSGAAASAKLAASLITADLSVTGLYRVLGPAEYDAPLGNCSQPNGGSFPRNLPEKRINQIVTGQVRSADGGGELLVLDLYLYDVEQGKDVLGKRYQVNAAQVPSAAHAFANEILAFLTGTPGTFGGQIVYASDAEGSRELFTIVLGSTERKQLTTDRARAASPAWSSDGKSVIYTSSKKPGESDVFMVPSAGGQSTRITYLPGEELRPLFSADGKQLLMAAKVSGKSAIALFNTRGRLLQKLSDSQGDDYDGAFTSGFDQIAFVSNRTGEAQLYTMNIDGGRVRSLEATAGRKCSRPAWSPTAGQIAAACSDTNGNQQLYLMPAQGGELTQITFQGENSEPAWSPDGRMIVFSTREKPGAQSDIAVFGLANLKVTMVARTPQDDREPNWSYAALN